MKRHRHTPEQIVRKLREGDRLLNEGKDLTEVLRHLEVSESSWNRWRSQYGGMKANEAKRLRELESENARLKKLLAEAELDKAMLKELAEETSDPEPSPPRGGDAARAVRGLPTTGMPGGGPAPVHPAARPAHTITGRAAPAGVAPRLRQGSDPVGLAASGETGPPGGLRGQ